MKIRRGELVRLILEKESDSLLSAQEMTEDANLGLSSLERVELLAQLEESLGTEIDEIRFANVTTNTDLKQFVEQTRSGGAAGSTSEQKFPNWVFEPRWTRTAPFRWARAGLMQGVFLPLARRYLGFEIHGVEHLEGLEGPVVFAANHSSHLDTVAVYAALPAVWRSTLAPAMSQDFFQALFEISHARLGVRCWEAFQFLLACGLFNAFPIPQKLAGTRRALQYAAELVDDGYSLLFFPEGTRSLDGSVLPFQSGISLIASKLRVAVVPVRIDGLFSLFPAGATWPKSGPVSVAFGAPVAKRDDESLGKAASRVREALLQLPVLGD